MYDRTILQHLCEVGTYEQQNACRQQLEDVQGSLRFVKYELDRKGGNEDGLPALQLDDIQVRNVDRLHCKYIEGCGAMEHM